MLTDFILLEFQEVTANFNEYTEYANYIGLNTACKMRWTTTGKRITDQ